MKISEILVSIIAFGAVIGLGYFMLTQYGAMVQRTQVACENKTDGLYVFEETSVLNCTNNTLTNVYRQETDALELPSWLSPYVLMGSFVAIIGLIIAGVLYSQPRFFEGCNICKEGEGENCKGCVLKGEK